VEAYSVSLRQAATILLPFCVANCTYVSTSPGCFGVNKLDAKHGSSLIVVGDDHARTELGPGIHASLFDLHTFHVQHSILIVRLPAHESPERTVFIRQHAFGQFLLDSLDEK